jgi:hypothetical protein
LRVSFCSRLLFGGDMLTFGAVYKIACFEETNRERTSGEYIVHYRIKVWGA